MVEWPILSNPSSLKPKTDGRKKIIEIIVILFWASITSSYFTISWAHTLHDEDYWVTLASENEVRSFDGTGNNEEHTEWGSVGQRQLRSLAQSNYSDGVSMPPGEGQPTPREILSEVFLATPSSTSTASALFVGWGLLVAYDLVRIESNASDPLDIVCNDAALADVWCPRGSQSEPIPFNRSQGEIDAEGDGARSPLNYATAYLDLDWMYGRDEDTAAEIRALENGYLNLTDDQLPHQLEDGAWLLADQRPATMPVTFALTTLLLREHNRCCDEFAHEWGAMTDQDAYDYCRQWTITVYQHITENDFSIRLIGSNIKVLGKAEYGGDGSYDNKTDAGADVVFSTVALPAFYSAMPSTVGLINNSLDYMEEHGMELTKASADVAGLVKRSGGIEPILIGAAYSHTQEVDVSFVAEVSSSSPLFNFPVETVQRGRDHGVPSYNDVREAYGFSRVTTFAEITPDETAQEILSLAYGADVDLLDAYVGAVAEKEEGSTLFAGPLLRSIFLEQLYRAVIGDRLHHKHTAENENAALSTLYGIIINNSLASSLELNVFTAPELTLSENCSDISVTSVTLAESYKLAWNQSTSDDAMYITLSARDIGTEGMMGIGFGGSGMMDTGDFVICEVISSDNATCTDRSGPGARSEPPLDDEGDTTELDIAKIVYDGDWTSVTFVRGSGGNDDSDYSLADDIDVSDDTSIIYAWRSGPGIQQHPNSQRGAATVNFVDGSVAATCDDSNNYFALHGALLLLAWMLIAPYGLFHARYCKGRTSVMGNLWWEMHEECMVVCAEALLPLAITALFTTGGPHNSAHAKWGFYMIAAVSLQLGTGWARARALEAKGNNFSLFHRTNKYVHIYSGWLAYVAGLAQCYRGLELISGSDQLIFEGYDIGFHFASFNVVKQYIFPVWLAIVPPIFLFLEIRKQFTRFFTKGAASVCGVVEVVNQNFTAETVMAEVEDRLMPRTEELPIYTTKEFNEKILNGRSWVIVDGAVLDVSSFAKQHPGGARLIMNTVGTDVTSEIIGEDASIGNSNMAFTPHPHTDIAVEISRSLVVGYIEEEGDIYSDSEGGGTTSVDLDSSAYSKEARHRLSSQSGSDSNSDSFMGPRAPAHLSSSAFFRGEKAARLGRLASYSSADAIIDRSRASSGASAEERRRASSSAREQRLSSAEAHHNRRRSLEGQARTGIAVGPTVGPKVKLSAEAEAIFNKGMEPSSGPAAGAEAPMVAEKSPSASASGAEGSGSMMAAEAAETKESRRASARIASDDVMTPAFEDDYIIPGNSGAPASQSIQSPRMTKMRLRLRHTLAIGERPMALAIPLAHNSGSHEKLESAPEDDSKGEKMRITSFHSMFKRFGVQEGATSGTSGDERERKKEDGKPFKTTRRIWDKKNPLDFFHVCPLVFHENMGGGNGRPVHKFVFACPGKTAALVTAMEGVCHFNMRLAQQPGMTVVQRAYNAFAVRVTSEEGKVRSVLPASETKEGDLCIEMRIRLYSDGLMSNLLSQLIKNLDNPAVQLQGPFLQDRVNPPPAHRNVVMIAAGTGINPMVQLIRDYLNLGSHTEGGGRISHSRLVLLWQNNVEQDFYCAEELTQLQVKANGLLEVTALVSGDITRRNRPGRAFRRTKSRMMKRRKNASVNPTTGEEDSEGGRKVSQQGELKEEGTMVGKDQAHRLPSRLLKLARDLSLVPEEDSVSRATSSVYSINVVDSITRDLEAGSGSGVRDQEGKSGDDQFLSGQGGGSDSKRRIEKDDGSEEKLMKENVEGVGSHKPVLDADGAVDRGKMSAKIGREDSLSGASMAADGTIRCSSNRQGGSADVKGEGDGIRVASSATQPGRFGGTKDAVRQTGIDRERSSGSIHEKVNVARESSGRRKSQGKSKSPVHYPLSEDPRIGSVDDISEGEPRAAGHRSSRAALTPSSPTPRPRSLRNPPRTPPRTRSTRRRSGQSRMREAGDTMPTEPRRVTSLHELGAGLVHSKLTKDILRMALGSQVMKSIAMARTSALGVSKLETAANIAGGARAALRELVGTEDTPGRLQVVVSGPAGFVFHVEGLLADLRVPPQVIAMLD